MIGFNSTNLGSAYNPQFLPDVAVPNNLIALAWTDLNPSSGGTISYLTNGTAPNRKLIVSYINVNRYGSANTISGRIELYESSDIVQIHSVEISSGTNTMGLENSNGTVAVPVAGRNNSSWSISVPEAVQFAPYNSTMVWQPASVNASALNVTVPANYSFTYSYNGCVYYSDTAAVTACNSSVNINVKAFLQGFYRGGSKMISNLGAGSCDTLFLKLAKNTAPYSILFSDTAIIDTSGNAGFEFPSSINGNSYYLVVQHRNSLETWSSSPVLMNSGTINYDFTMSSGSAYGNNLCNLGDGRFAIWTGDIDRNNLIDISDINLMHTKNPLLLHGYYVGDLTGDQFTESADYSLLENNVPLMLQVAKP